MELYPKHSPAWTHRLCLPDHVDPVPLLDLLERVLVLRAIQDLDAVIALDFYSQPNLNGEQGLTYTTIGALINAIKYKALRKEEVAEAGSRLTAPLVEVVRAHPWFRTADLVLAVPGHDPNQVAASVRIGVTVAKHVELPHALPRNRRSGFRKSVKDMAGEERAELLDGFAIDEDLTGRTVLVVDDVFHTGCTMRGVARAARLAGASTVLGLTGARNWRY
ncbi:ComF family protein [Amycolatopsis sp. MEPSY49]|uniref:ComF family protein n=1 Tax=Amycolatopsis sp. MEPSY49 TaxID=3151600 RepID=UPI003EF91160